MKDSVQRAFLAERNAREASGSLEPEKMLCVETCSR
jgi:hypothetical protein